VRAGHPTRTRLLTLASGIKSLFERHASREGKRHWINQTDGDPGEMVVAQERLHPGSTSVRAAEERMGQWRSGMSARDKATFKMIANDLLVSLGYARDAEW